MPNPYFRFKQFTIFHDRCAMKVTTDACLFGAWCAAEIQGLNRDGPENKNLLEVGTGTGLLSLMMAQKNNLHIDAVEIDPEAAQQAKENAISSPWKENIAIVNNDILNMQAAAKYDFVVSNPPFYENELSSGHPKKNTAHHSSHLTLSQLLPVIKNNVTGEGLFFLLLPFKRIHQIENLLTEHQLYINKKVIVQPSVLHQPFRVMLMGSKRKKTGTVVSHLSIWNEQRQYTDEFAALLKDYYLAL